MMSVRLSCLSKSSFRNRLPLTHLHTLLFTKRQKETHTNFNLTKKIRLKAEEETQAKIIEITEKQTTKT